MAETLPKFFLLQPGQIRETFRQIKPLLDRIPPAPVASDVNLMRVGFDEEILLRLRRWKAAIETLSEPVRDALMLLFYSALYDCSYGSNDGQFTRIRRDKKPLWPDDAILRRVEAAEEDLLRLPLVFPLSKGVPVTVLREDARKLESLPIQANFVITSPPYLNRYDYTRSYCFELCFGFVRDFQELRNLRHSLLRSHIESRVDGHDGPASPAIREVLDCLAQKNLNNSKIPDMIRGYFADMAAVIRGLSRVLVPQGRVAMVVDNVRFEGEMIPVDLILCHIAEEMGLQVEAILICRFKGNSSQQMARYGRLPVRESVVVWRKA